MRQAILLVAYGAANEQAREGLRKFEALCRTRLSSYTVRWAYTSYPIRERLAMRKQKSDSVRKALMRLHMEKYGTVYIQPLQTIPGNEHQYVCDSADAIKRETNMGCIVGEPLLATPQDAPPLATAIIKHLPVSRKDNEAVVLMGHGTKHPAVSLYDSLGKELANRDKNIHLGTMNGTTRLEHILPKLDSSRVWLIPLLSVIGAHALKDMAGEGPQTWKSRIEARGYQCMPVLHGMSECVNIAEIWLNHLEDAIRKFPLV